MKNYLKKIGSKKGQALVEYILLMALVFGLLAGVFWPQILKFARSVTQLQEAYRSVLAQRRIGIPMNWFGGNPTDFDFEGTYVASGGGPAGSGGGLDSAEGADTGADDGPDGGGGEDDVGDDGTGSDIGPSAAGNDPLGGETAEGGGPEGAGRGRRGRRGAGNNDNFGGVGGEDGGAGTANSAGRRGGDTAQGDEGGEAEDEEDGGGAATRAKNRSRPQIRNRESSDGEDKEREDPSEDASQSKKKKSGEVEAIKGDKDQLIANSDKRRGKGCQEMDFWALLKIGILIGITILVAVVFFSAITKGEK